MIFRRMWAFWNNNRLGAQIENLEFRVDEINSKVSRAEGRLTADLNHVKNRIEPLREIMMRMRKDMAARDRGEE